MHAQINLCPSSMKLYNTSYFHPTSLHVPVRYSSSHLATRTRAVQFVPPRYTYPCGTVRPTSLHVPARYSSSHLATRTRAVQFALPRYTYPRGTVRPTSLHVPARYSSPHLATRTHAVQFAPPCYTYPRGTVRPTSLHVPARYSSSHLATRTRAVQFVPPRYTYPYGTVRPTSLHVPLRYSSSHLATRTCVVRRDHLDARILLSQVGRESVERVGRRTEREATPLATRRQRHAEDRQSALIAHVNACGRHARLLVSQQSSIIIEDCSKLHSIKCPIVHGWQSIVAKKN